MTCKPSKKVKIPLTTKSSNYLLIPFPIDETDSPRMLYQDLDSKNKILFYYNEPDIIKESFPEDIIDLIIIKSYIWNQKPIYVYYKVDDANKYILISYNNNKNNLCETNIMYSQLYSKDLIHFTNIDTTHFIITFIYISNGVSYYFYLDGKTNNELMNWTKQSSDEFFSFQCLLPNIDGILCIKETKEHHISYNILQKNGNAINSDLVIESITIQQYSLKMQKANYNNDRIFICFISVDQLVECYLNTINNENRNLSFNPNQIYFKTNLNSSQSTIHFFQYSSLLYLIVTYENKNYYEIININQESTKQGVNEASTIISLYPKYLSNAGDTFLFYISIPESIYLYTLSSDGNFYITASNSLETMFFQVEKDQASSITINKVDFSNSLSNTINFIQPFGEGTILFEQGTTYNEFIVTGTKINNYLISYYYAVDNGNFYYTMWMNIYPRYCNTIDESGMKCLTCKKGAYYDEEDSLCYDQKNVKPGYYYDDELGKIVKCDDNCAICEKIKIGLSKCLECQQNFFLKNYRCMEGCNDNDYAYKGVCYEICPSNTVGVTNKESGNICLSYQDEINKLTEELSTKINDFLNILEESDRINFFETFSINLGQNTYTNQTELFINIILFHKYYKIIQDSTLISQKITETIIDKVVDQLTNSISTQKIESFSNSQLLLIIESFIQFVDNIQMLSNGNFKTIQTFYEKYLTKILESDNLSDLIITAIIEANNQFIILSNINNYQYTENSKEINGTLFNTSQAYFFNYSIIPNYNNSVVMELIDINMKMSIKLNKNDSSYISPNYNLLSFPYKRNNYSQDIEDESMNISISFSDNPEIYTPGKVLDVMKQAKIKNKIIFPSSVQETFSSIGVIKYQRYPYLNPKATENISDSFISIRLYDDSMKSVKINNTNETIKIIMHKGKKHHQCVFYDENLQKLNNEGCLNNNLNDYVICSCTHLTDFSIANFKPTNFLYPDQAELGEFIDRRFIYTFEPFSILNAKNAISIYIYSFIFISYFFLLIYSIHQDLTKENGHNLIIEIEVYDNDEKVAIFKNTIDDKIDEIKEKEGNNTQINKRESNPEPTVDNSISTFQLQNHLIRVESDINYKNKNNKRNIVIELQDNHGIPSPNSSPVLSKRNRSLPYLNVTTSPSSNQCLLPFKIIFFEMLKNENRLISIFAGTSYYLSKMNKITLLFFRICLQVSICAIITTSYTSESSIIIGNHIVFACYSLLLSQIIIFIFEIALSKTKTKKTNDLVKLSLLKYKKIFFVIIVYCILSTIILGSVFNSIWIDLYMELYNRKVYFWYDFWICFFLDHFVLGILILIIKSGILLRLIKIDNPESCEFQFAKKFVFTLTDVFIVYSLYE